MRRRFLAPFLVLAMPLGVAIGQTPLAPPQAPVGNPVTLAKTNLGQTLFWDEQMSSTRTVACGTCHNVDVGGADRRSVSAAYYPGFHPGADGIFGTEDDVNGSLGVPLSTASGDYEMHPIFGISPQVTSRQAPTVIDAAYVPELFWDGRAGGAFVDPITGSVVLAAGAALESQVLGPPANTTEMAHLGRDWNDVALQISAARPLALSPLIPADLEAWLGCRSYPALFEEAFGTPVVTPARIAMAIATYERTLYSDQTPFDDALAGVPGALTPSESAGRALFASLRCAECHPSSRLTDDSYYYIGVRPAIEDPGRFAVTGDPADLGAFKTPTLRHVELRPPYMHDGRFHSLEEVVEFYDRGGDFTAPHIDPRMVPLGLSPQEKADLVAFMKRPLNDPRVLARQPPFDRPHLHSESQRLPMLVEPGTRGASGSLPSLSALEPPVGGNPSFTVGVTAALGGATAQLVIDDVIPGASPPLAPSFFSATIVLAGVGAGNGTGSVSLPIPDDPRLVGVPLYARWYVTDGGLSASEIFDLRVFRKSCCQRICGDCDESSTPPDVLDSLEAARIAVGLVALTSQGLCCDVDASGVVDILDSLRLAQVAAGLAVVLSCR